MNDYRPVCVTLTVMKYLEQLLLAHIKNSVDITVDPHQYAYRKKKSVSDAVSAVIHSALTHLEGQDTYVRLLFLDCSAFNSIIPQTLAYKLLLLGLEPSMCKGVQATVCEDPRCLIVHHRTQHRLSTGVCFKPPPVHATRVRFAPQGTRAIVL